MKKQKTTLRDIAKAANVSMMSVSRALRGGVGVSGELRTRITRLAEELGYAFLHFLVAKNHTEAKLAEVLEEGVVEARALSLLVLGVGSGGYGC